MRQSIYEKKIKFWRKASKKVEIQGQFFSILQQKVYYSSLLQMAYRVHNPTKHNDPDNFQKQRLKAHRRLNATTEKLEKEDEKYYDTRNLWKSSTIKQEKQYEAIKNSGILSQDRKVTFLRFNYRRTEEKNMGYTDVYQKKIVKPKQQILYQITNRKKEKQSQLFLEIADCVRKKTLRQNSDWLKEFHGTSIETQSFTLSKVIPPGSMNVSDLWGERQLQQSLGFLPCNRDRPKLLKLYSKMNTNPKRPYIAKRCKTQQKQNIE